MLTIRAAQMKIVGIEGMLGDIRTHYPQACKNRSEGWIREFTSLVWEKTLFYGIKSSSDIMKFTGWMLSIHHEFELLEDGAWARTILLQKNLSGTEKIDLISEQLPMRTLSRLPRTAKQ
jgi:hypothetical protein